MINFNLMDSFLYYGDYAKQIALDNLQQIIGGNQTILDGIQRAAVEECISYLKQKYDTEKEFEDTTQYDRSLVYKAENTVYLNANAYSASSTYALNSLTLQAGNVYRCTTAITVPEVFNISHWTLLGQQWDLFYTLLPKPMFQYDKVYVIGDQVFWKDKTFTCKIATSILTHDAKLQMGIASGINVLNIFPDDPVSGVQYWGVGVAYSVPANTDLTNTTYWTKGDNRDQKLLMTCIDIALYHAHCRISPRNIPELRIMRYMGNDGDRETRGQRILYPTYSALGWLQAAAIGDDITPELPRLQPYQGARIRFGGNVKNVNNY